MSRWSRTPWMVSPCKNQSRQPNRPAFRAVLGAGTDEPIAIPFMEIKGIDNDRIWNVIPLDEWLEGADGIHGFAIAMVDSAHQNRSCRHTGGEEKISPVYRCRHGCMIGLGLLNGILLVGSFFLPTGLR